MNRRDFISTGRAGPATIDVSCERLFIRYLDAVDEGSEHDFLKRTLADFSRARCVHLKEAYWLDKKDLRNALTPVLAEYKAQGGTVEFN